MNCVGTIANLTALDGQECRFSYSSRAQLVQIGPRPGKAQHRGCIKKKRLILYATQALHIN